MINPRDAKIALEAGCATLGLQMSVEILEIKHGHVLVLDYDQDLKFPNFAHSMIRLERFMKTYMKVQELELQTLSMEDKNKRVKRSGREEEKLVSARNVESLH